MIDPLSLLNSDNYGVYNRAIARIVGLKAAVLLAELISKRSYHARNGELVDHHRYGEGLFYHTVDAVDERVALTRDEQEVALKKLKRLELVSTSVFGLPGKRYFKLHDEKILSLLGLKPLEVESTYEPESGEDPNGLNPDDLPPTTGRVTLSAPTIPSQQSDEHEKKPEVVDAQSFLCSDLKNSTLTTASANPYEGGFPSPLPLPLKRENNKNKEERSRLPCGEGKPVASAPAAGPAVPVYPCDLKPLSKTHIKDIQAEQKHGSHVVLEPREYDALSKFMGEACLKKLIEQMNDYCAALKPRGYKSYAAALRMWHRRHAEKDGSPGYKAPYRGEVVSEHEKIRRAQYQRWLDANGDPSETWTNILRFD